MTKFIDFLDSCEWFDGELLINDMESEFSFVWDGDYTFSEYGKEKFKPILDAEIKFNTNLITLDCECSEDLVDLFHSTVAGYVGETEYNKIIVAK